VQQPPMGEGPEPLFPQHSITELKKTLFPVILSVFIQMGHAGVKIALAAVRTGIDTAFVVEAKDTRDVLLAGIVSLGPAISDRCLSVASTEAIKIPIKVRYRIMLVSAGSTLSPGVLPSPELSVRSWVPVIHMSEIFLALKFSFTQWKYLCHLLRFYYLFFFNFFSICRESEASQVNGKPSWSSGNGGVV